MRLIITDNVGRWAAQYVKASVDKHKPSATHKYVLGLPTGGTAVPLYENLVKLYNGGQIDFENIITFNMDEYIGLPANHEQSYHRYMYENLFNHVNIKRENIHILDGNAADVAKECRLYDEAIAKAGGVRLFLGGVGENGHIAFNEPYSSFESVTRDKVLDASTIAANARFFNNIDEVPKSALTIGIKTLIDSDEVLIMVTGERKARALRECIEGGVSHVWPITYLQLHRKAIIVADEAAVSELQVKTYRYFKALNDEFSYIDGLTC